MDKNLKTSVTMTVQFNSADDLSKFIRNLGPVKVETVKPDASDDDGIVLSSGRRIRSYFSALALGKSYDTPPLWPVAYTIDGDPGDVTEVRSLADACAASDEGPLTSEEREEIAARMISAWREWEVFGK